MAKNKPKKNPGRIRKAANRLYNRIFPLEDSSTRGIGGAVAKIDQETHFTAYFNPIVNRIPLTKSYKELTEEIFNQLPDDTIREIITKSSPIVAKAAADYADAMASGYTFTSDRTLGQEPDTPAQQLIEDFFQRLEQEQGGLQGIIAEIARGMFMHGGIFLELVIAEDGRTPVAIKVLSPSTAVFKRSYDPILGEFYELGQEIPFGEDARQRVGARINEDGVNFVSFHDDPTIQYRPIQSEPNNPYGVPIINPAVFHVIMMAGFFAAFKDALSGHVWPNLLITLDKEKFKENAGSKDPKVLEAKLKKATEDILAGIARLKPGNAIVTGDEVAIEGNISGQNRAPLGSIKDIQDVIRRELIIAVQSQPIFMASNEATAETHVLEQRKAYGQLIRRGQKSLNGVLTEFMNLILQLNGHPRLAEFKLAYVNTADYKEQAETFNQFRAGLLTASEDLLKFVEALDMAKNSQYINEQQAQDMFDEGMEIRREVNIIPKDL